MKFWDETNERMSREDIAQVQFERLQATLNRVFKNVNHYRNRFLGIDFVPEDLRSLEDFRRLPFIARKDLMDNYPYGMFAVPLREVVRLHAPSFSLENPVVMGFTPNDLRNWAELMARNLTAVGVGRDDVVQISLNFGIMTGPFGVQLGAELIGASVLPMSGESLPNQVKIMRDFRTTILVSTPTFGLSLIRTMENLGIDPKSLSLRCGVFGAEPWSEETRNALEERLHITATDVYGLTEVFGPGVAWECGEKNGLHIPEDHFIPEIIDPDSCRPLPPGEEGELVLTTISKEAFPLIRFRTGALSRIDNAPCRCGRSHCRISRIFARCDDVVVVRGTGIVPEQLGLVMAQAAGHPLKFQLSVERESGRDDLKVMVEISPETFFDEMKKQRRFVESLHRAVTEFLGWEVPIKLVEPGSIETGRLVIDKRNFALKPSM
jgi:phenylacetate-CoA ligase